MGKFIDLTNKTFGKLTIIERVDNKGNRICWKCLCECGTTKIIDGMSIKLGRTISCGCAIKENNSKGNQHKKHGMAKTRPYRIWRHMVERCTTKSCKSYNDYGGRGIKVCEKWLMFEGFWEDMKESYSDHLTIDRINNNGDYEKSNCQWSTTKTQARNRRSNRLVTLNGETKPLAYFSEKYNKKEYQVWTRLKWGWSLETALTTPIRKLTRGAK